MLTHSTNIDAQAVGEDCEWGADGPGSACGSACADAYGAACVIERRGVLLSISCAVLGLTKWRFVRNKHFHMQLWQALSTPFRPHFCIRQNTSNATLAGSTESRPTYADVC